MRASFSLVRAVLVHSDIDEPIATAGAERPLTVNLRLRMALHPPATRSRRPTTRTIGLKYSLPSKANRSVPLRELR